MKNLFKFVCIITFLFGSFAFAQSTQSEQKKHVVKVKYCKKIKVSVSIGIASVETEVVGCLVTVDGLPIMWWGKNASGSNQSDQKVDYLYVEEQELIRKLNIKGSKDLENMKIIKSGIWDYEGINYVIDTEANTEVFEVDGIKYYAFHLQKVK